MTQMTATPRLFDPRPCVLGEGPMWHPLRSELFWFDIIGQRLLARGLGGNAGTADWHFDEPVSAAAWIDQRHLLVASASALLRLDLDSGTHSVVAPLEAENAVTRSNDGRADPWGGFWIGTMGRRAEPGQGSIWRYYRGTLRRLHSGLTITNAISFDPSGRWASFADTAARRIWRQPLDPRDGWPAGDPVLLVDLSARNLNPDGASFDSDGALWVAMWGDSSVRGFDADGQEVGCIRTEVPQPSCPTFGGPDMRHMFVTSARQDMDDAALAEARQSGATFVVEGVVKGCDVAAVTL